jgi:hypothetical protein
MGFFMEKIRSCPPDVFITHTNVTKFLLQGHDLCGASVVARPRQRPSTALKRLPTVSHEMTPWPRALLTDISHGNLPRLGHPPTSLSEVAGASVTSYNNTRRLILLAERY